MPDNRASKLEAMSNKLEASCCCVESSCCASFRSTDAICSRRFAISKTHVADNTQEEEGIDIRAGAEAGKAIGEQKDKPTVGGG